MRKALLLLFLCFHAMAWAQTDIDRFPSGVVQITDGWRVHSGDDATWSRADFDDSHWPTKSLSADAAQVTPGWRWYRTRLNLPSVHPPLALLIVGPDQGYQLFVDGVAVPGSDIRGIWHLRAGRERVFSLLHAGQSAEVAIRVHYPDPDTQTYGLFIGQVLVGPVPAIEAQRRFMESRRTLAVFPTAAIDLAQLLAGCAIIFLFLLQRASREYLYLGLYLFLSGFSTFTFYAVQMGCVPDALNNLCGDPMGYVELILQVEFAYAFLRRRVSRGWRVVEFAMLGCMACSLLLDLHVLPAAIYLSIEAAANLPVALVLPSLLVLWFIRGDSEAGWLVLPTLLPAAGDVAADLGLVASLLGWKRLVFLNSAFQVGPLNLHSEDITNFLYLLAIGVAMVLRFTRVGREQARNAAELDAAREIQQSLVPPTLPAVAGFYLEAAYVPNQEVGGDFYQVLEQPDGRLLIIIGDVSGKGLKAAMTGALTLGALRAIAAENPSPATLLSRLNRQLFAAVGSGFVTCLCARVDPNGTLTLANAGHLQPYRDGEEVELDADLPLGIVEDVEYVQTSVALRPGDRITLMTDGIVEAQSATGELLGFDRTRDLSRLSAEQIARTAQTFGQQDDITVLTFTFAPVQANT